MVHVFCMLSDSALHFCEVSWKYLWQFQNYEADTNDGSADGRTNTQNFGQYIIIPSPLFVAGHKKCLLQSYVKDIILLVMSYGYWKLFFTGYKGIWVCKTQFKIRHFFFHLKSTGIFSYFLTKTCCGYSLEECLSEALLMSTLNIYFYGQMRKTYKKNINNFWLKTCLIHGHVRCVHCLVI